MTVPNIGGLIWNQRWQVSGEGAFTIYQKIKTANALSSGFLDKYLRGRTSLAPEILANSSLRILGTPATFWNSLLRGAELRQLLSEWTEGISGTENVRYCAECFKVGFHANVFQIDGLDRCPIHGKKLRDTCARCGWATPMYSNFRKARSALTCIHCGLPWFGNDLSVFDIDSWHAPDGLERLAPITNWLEGIVSRKMRWMNLSNWKVAPNSTRQTDRAAVLYALAKLTCFPTSDFRNSDVRVFGPFSRVRYPWGRLLRDVQYVEARRKRCQRVDIFPYAEHFRALTNGHAIPISPEVPPDIHAAYIFRRQFEYSDVLQRIDRHPLEVKQLGMYDLSFRLHNHNSNNRIRYIETEVAALHEEIFDITLVGAKKLAELWHQKLLSDFKVSDVISYDQAFSVAQLYSDWGSGFSPIGVIFDDWDTPTNYWGEGDIYFVC